MRTLTLAPGVTHAEGYRRLSGWILATHSFAQFVARTGGVEAPAPIDSGPLVSVVVRTRDRPQFLGDALASLAGSSYREVEIVLVNDGGAPPVAPAGYPFPIVRMEHAQPLGRAAAAQAGVDAARGALIAFLDDDDIVTPEHLATLVGAMRATQARVVYRIAAVDGAGPRRRHGDRMALREPRDALRPRVRCRPSARRQLDRGFARCAHPRPDDPRGVRRA